jgi:hypothetical protein
VSQVILQTGRSSGAEKNERKKENLLYEMLVDSDFS